MTSVYSSLYSLLLFSQLSRLSVSVAMPSAKGEDGAMEQDGLFLGAEPMAEPAVVSPVYRRSLVQETNEMNEDGSPKFFILSDMGLKEHGIRGLNPAFTRSFPLLTDRSLSHTPAEHSLKIDRRNTDIDILRCMIGRVYRPCWTAV
ncbi:pro-MCH [Plectropomus leopardus]|uniref:pro-MCH n=1 Tax=Plectropomus leopardus TaxID=160734 RepID=UPI001C4BF263|nr:pro-MCH [Plectropomus leopardus]